MVIPHPWESDLLHLPEITDRLFTEDSSAHSLVRPFLAIEDGATVDDVMSACSDDTVLICVTVASAT